MAGNLEGKYNTHTHIFVRKASHYMTIAKLLPIKEVYKYN